MQKLKKLIGLTMLWLAVSSCTSAQPPRSSEASVELSDYTLSFVALDTNKLALTGAMVIDGTGGPVKVNQTIFLEDGKITFVGDANQVPVGFRVMELSGKTLIPGIVGTHNHMRLPQGTNSVPLCPEMGVTFFTPVIRIFTG